MAFHDIRFPANVSFGSLGGPERLTEIVTLANGFEAVSYTHLDVYKRQAAGHLVSIGFVRAVARRLDQGEVRLSLIHI